MLLAVLSALLPSSSSVTVLSKEEAQKEWLDDDMYGTQPDVAELLETRANCSGWIWGTCYVTDGSCGDGTRVASRSGTGCRIIALTVRCHEPCSDKWNSYSGASWGINEISDPQEEAGKNKYPDEYALDAFDNNQFVADDHLSPSLEPEDGEHCRYLNADWSACQSDGTKKRTRTLRTNRREADGLICPVTKRDTKHCTYDSPGSGASEPATGDGLACSWRKSSKTCQKCDKARHLKKCSMSLKKGNPDTCGKTREYTMPCNTNN
jgi:hypothetical protein